MIDRSTLANSFEFIATAGARARPLQYGATPRVAVDDRTATTIVARDVRARVVEKIEATEPIDSSPAGRRGRE
jgi:DNA-directed RNA polymerase subunit K/omega